MKTIIILSLLCICFNSYAQYPAKLTPGNATIRDLAKLECTSCSIRSLTPESTYYFWTYIEPKMSAEERITNPGTPKVSISFRVEKGKTYILQLYMDPQFTRVFDIARSSNTIYPHKEVYNPNKGVNDLHNIVYTAENNGEVKYQISAKNSDIWMFNYCIIHEIDIPSNL